jgi:hypothetical protein
VQHHRRRCLDQNDLENHRRVGDTFEIGQHERALATRYALGLVLHAAD